LLVDADEQSLEALRRALCSLPCTLVQATCAEQALRKALKSTHSRLQAIMLSGFADLREIKQAAGGTQLHRCLTKPLSPAQLMAAVQPLITARESLAEPPASADRQLAEHGALAALERKYPGISQFKADWQPKRG
jgi:DNA-binding NtrC family response regulator